VSVPVGVLIAPTADLKGIAGYISDEQSGRRRLTSDDVHAYGTNEIRAADLVLSKFIDDAALLAALDAPHVTGAPRTVLLTGANGWLGRFLAIEWMQRLADSGGAKLPVAMNDDDVQILSDRGSVNGDLAIARRYALSGRTQIDAGLGCGNGHRRRGDRCCGPASDE
jgi:fatty acid CoA ligase FadD9